MNITTIRITKELKAVLDKIKIYRRETYEDVIKRLIEQYEHETKR